MKAGWGNGTFIADAHSDRVTLAEMRVRWAAGDYGNLRKDYATGWLKLAGKAAPMTHPQPRPDGREADGSYA